MYLFTQRSRRSTPFFGGNLDGKTLGENFNINGGLSNTDKKYIQKYQFFCFFFKQKLEYSHFLKVHLDFFDFFLQREYFHFLPI